LIYQYLIYFRSIYQFLIYLRSANVCSIYLRSIYHHGAIFFLHASQGPMLWLFKYFRRKIHRKNWRFWLKIKLKYAKIWSEHWFLRKTPLPQRPPCISFFTYLQKRISPSLLCKYLILITPFQRIVDRHRNQLPISLISWIMKLEY
jgi:hypothetical protein